MRWHGMMAAGVCLASMLVNLWSAWDSGHSLAVVLFLFGLCSLAVLGGGYMLYVAGKIVAFKSIAEQQRRAAEFVEQQFRDRGQDGVSGLQGHR